VLLLMVLSPGDVAAVGDAPTPVTITALHVTNGKLTDTTYISPIDFGAGSAVSAKITKCPNSAWTKTVGATQVDQCSEFRQGTDLSV
jgi:hypothetical protein